MKQYKLTAADFSQQQSTTPDAVLPDDDPIHEMLALSGQRPLIPVSRDSTENTRSVTENMSHTANEKAEYQRKHNIQPGTPEWFRLWFSLPKLTNEKPWD